jgi:predicted CXXCH cytochrome family protein
MACALPLMIMMTVLLTGQFEAAAAEHPPVKGMTQADCAGCHETVTSRTVLHGPAAAGDCAACHVADNTPGKRRVALKNAGANGDTTALCVSCHQETGKRLEQAHRHAPVAAGRCTACHDPHGSPFKFQLADEGSRACVRCHEDIGQALAQSHVHAPAAAACSICHDAHAGSHPGQMKAAANVVCLACHLEKTSPPPAADPRALFGRMPADGDRLIAAAPRVALDTSLRAGHPTIGHPVDGRRDPAEPTRDLRCTSCHNPHGAAGGKLLRFGATGTSPLCVRCHKF